MRVERLVAMANDIGAFFHAEPDHEEAVKGVVLHLQRFWEPRMRQQIIAHLRAGGEGLEALPREAIQRLADEAQKTAARPA
jgi:formate dehydrogenase subunit delta